MNMERIRLSKNEKEVLRLVSLGDICPDTYPKHTFALCVRSLERKGLVKGAFIEGGDVEGARLTRNGRDYLIENPGLRNPIDWKWWIGTSIGVATFIVVLIALLIACSK